MPSESLHNEGLLVEAMQGGCERAFTALYRHYSPQLYINILGIVRDPLRAEEIVQELFTRIWQNRERPGLKENFGGYVYRTAQHLVHDFFRSLQRDRTLQERFRLLACEHYEHIEENMHQSQLKAILQRAVDQLSPQQKRAYKLVKIEGHTYKQAALIMGISPLTVKEYLTNSHKSIRSYLHQKEGRVWALLVLLFVSVFL